MAESYTLSAQTQERDRTMAWREELRRAKGEREGEQFEDEGEEQPQSLRESVMRTRRQKAIAEAKKEAEDTMATPARAATNSILKSAWRIMLTVIGFVPGLLYVNLHVFLGKVFGNSFFCKLGREWIPAAANIAAKDTSEQAGKSIGFFESVGLVALDFLFILLIIIIIAVIMVIIEMATGGIFGWLVDWFI